MTRVTTFVGLHLRDPDLTPERIAEAHNVSVRQLYKACAAAGMSLEQWIIDQRLEAARAELVTPVGPSPVDRGHRSRAVASATRATSPGGSATPTACRRATGSTLAVADPPAPDGRRSPRPLRSGCDAVEPQIPEDAAATAARIAAGYAIGGRRAGAGLGAARRRAASRRAGPDAAGHAQPARPHRGRHRHRQDEDAAGDRRAAVGGRRARRARRHQGRPQRAGPAGRPRATGSPRAPPAPATRGRATAYPVEFLSLGGLGPGRAGARDGDRLRPGAPVEGARPQPDAGELARADLPLRRRRRAAAAGPQGPAVGRQLAGQRRGQAAS